VIGAEPNIGLQPSAAAGMMSLRSCRAWLESIMSGASSDNYEDGMAAFPGPNDLLFDFVAQTPASSSDFSRKQDWYFYINGYKDAADLLVAHAAEVDMRKVGYPIMFLYRQHLELGLKALIRDCRCVIGCHEVFPKTHRIDELWQICGTLLDELVPGTSDDEAVKHTTRLIAEFSKLDPTSEAFRYPEDKNGNSKNVVAEEIALATVREVIGKISLLLECIATDVHTRRIDAF